MKSNESRKLLRRNFEVFLKFSKFSIQQVGERFNTECQPQVPMVQASLNQRYPVILKFMPTNNETIYDKYVVKIDKETTAELKSFMAKLPGHVNVAMDGVTVLSKQKVSLPCSV